MIFDQRDTCKLQVEMRHDGRGFVGATSPRSKGRKSENTVLGRTASPLSCVRTLNGSGRSACALTASVFFGAIAPRLPQPDCSIKQQRRQLEVVDGAVTIAPQQGLEPRTL